MEFTTLNSTHDEIVEAIRGVWGKDVLKDCTLVYAGQIIIGIADNTEILDRNVKCSHYEWNEIGNGCFLSILK